MCGNRVFLGQRHSVTGRSHLYKICRNINIMCYVALKGSRRLGKVTKVSGSEKRDREAKWLN